MVSRTIKKQKKTKTKVKSKVQSRRKIGKIVKKSLKNIKKNNKSRSRSTKRKTRVKKGGSGHGENYGNYGNDGNYDDDIFDYFNDEEEEEEAQHNYGAFNLEELNDDDKQFVVDTFCEMGDQKYSHLCEYLDEECENFNYFLNNPNDDNLNYVVLYTNNDTQNLLGYLKVTDLGVISGIRTYYVNIICALTRIRDGLNGNDSNNDVFAHIKRNINQTNISRLLFERFFDELYTRHGDSPHNTVLVTVLPVPSGTIRQIVREGGFEPYDEFTANEDNAPFDNEVDNDKFYKDVGEAIEEDENSLWYVYYNNEHDHPEDEDEDL